MTLTLEESKELGLRALAQIKKHGVLRENQLASDLDATELELHAALHSYCADGTLVTCSVEVIGHRPQTEYRISATAPKLPPMTLSTRSQRTAPVHSPEGVAPMTARDKLRTQLERAPAEGVGLVEMCKAAGIAYAGGYSALQSMIAEGEVKILGKEGKTTLYGLKGRKGAPAKKAAKEKDQPRGGGEAQGEAARQEEAQAGRAHASARAAARGPHARLPGGDFLGRFPRHRASGRHPAALGA